LVYFSRDFLADGFGRFFSCGVSISSIGRKRQIFSFTSTKERLNSWYRWNSATSCSTFRTAAGLGNASLMVFPRTL
jgi:hypothetical protein